MSASETRHRETTEAAAWKLRQLRLVAAEAADAIPRALRHLLGDHDPITQGADDLVRVLPDVPADSPHSDRNAA